MKSMFRNSAVFHFSLTYHSNIFWFGIVSWIVKLTGVRSASKHPAGIIRGLTGSEFYLSVYWVCRGYNRPGGVFILWEHEGTLVHDLKVWCSYWTFWFRQQTFSKTFGMYESHCRMVKTPSKSSGTVVCVTPLLYMIWTPPSWLLEV